MARPRKTDTDLRAALKSARDMAREARQQRDSLAAQLASRTERRARRARLLAEQRRARRAVAPESAGGIPPANDTPAPKAPESRGTAATLAAPATICTETPHESRPFGKFWPR